MLIIVIVANMELVLLKALSVFSWGWDNKEFAAIASMLFVMIKQLFYIKDGNTERRVQHATLIGKFELTDFKISTVKEESEEALQKANNAIEKAEKAEKKAGQAFECVQKINKHVNGLVKTVGEARKDYKQYIIDKHTDSLTKQDK